MENKMTGYDKFTGAGIYACAFSSTAASADVSKMQSGKDGFYEKLSKLNESSGLSLVFNFRQTNLDLYLFYEEVIKRGGFIQVTKNAKWGEVASALNVKSLPIQLQKVYGNLLWKYEQIYHYRSPEKVTMPPPSQVSGVAKPESLKGSGATTLDWVGKRKFCDQSSPVIACRVDDTKGPVEKRKRSNDNCLVSTVGPDTPEKKPLMTPSTKIHLKKDNNAPIRTRSAYQMYLKLECERQKKSLGESYGAQKIRDTAINSWKTLSENDRQPYIEASRKDKERYIREMADYEHSKKKEPAKDQNAYSPSFISFGAPSESSIPDESFIESSVQMLKNAKPSDPTFQIILGQFN